MNFGFQTVLYVLSLSKNQHIGRENQVLHSVLMTLYLVPVAMKIVMIALRRLVCLQGKHHQLSAVVAVWRD